MLDRRHFLKNLGLTGTLLAVPATIIQAAELPAAATAVDLTNITLKGNVNAAGRGI